ncbi:RNA polymerase sigma factor [Persicirhabdus sediminis]|uniref:RNA polymerase sigma factor n=1 Tax=Persicirhabdus sediminis TaxID=454144 RepID=A0A8J7MCP3_9BACT|nr:RNA polymerase sigma factor [Persicirhabdus sediminis]MBK1791259.1 RNA polymerase sigma factor [Persicirhabdus sediminis]
MESHGGEYAQSISTISELVEFAMSEYESQLIVYAMGYMHDLNRARDVVQDTYIRLYQQDVSKVRKNAKSWLYTVCRNRCLDVLRKEQRMILSDQPDLGQEPQLVEAPDHKVDQGERVTQLKACLDELPENQAKVILLKFEQGMSYKEISDETGLSGGNVGFLLHTGLKKLREIIPSDLLD